MKRLKILARTLLVIVLAVLFLGQISPAAAQGCASPANEIVAENCLPGNPSSQWDVSGDGTGNIDGFATDISVNKGQTIQFKVSTSSNNYRLDIYRMGYYGGNGARLVTTVQPSASLPQSQPSCINQTATGLIDCGNWAVSASWAVPANAVSGIYFAKLVREDSTSGSSHMYFIVRDDSGNSDILYQTSDTTWQAYNNYGGNSLYTGSPVGRAYKVSYNRPLKMSRPSPSGPFNSEYAMVMFLERNGYDVSYFTGVDVVRRPAEILEHQMFLSVGHDEYWSAEQRTNVENARNSGIHLTFLSANEIFWKTRWENSIDGSNTAYRTIVCYKETHAGAKIDPLPNVWTGTWRDSRAFNPEGPDPENGLTGTMFRVNGFAYDTMTVAAEYRFLRFWRNTSVTSLSPGQSVTYGSGILGYEWDEAPDNGFQPPGMIRMSSTTHNISNLYLLDNGSTYGSGTAVHNLTLYKHSSGALVFGSGTVQWAWGLANPRDYSGGLVSTDLQQATVNLFADMDSQPATLQAGLVAATKSTDLTGPSSSITYPTNGAVVESGDALTISGTASDTGGGVVGGVEVSVDNGATWRLATGWNNWNYVWTPNTTGSVTIRARATDDSGNIGSVSAPVTITVTEPSCPCSLWNNSFVPNIGAQTDGQPIEVGVRFRSNEAGYITGLRYYKGIANTGTHTGHLWSNTGTLLATAVFTNETAAGWQEVSFSSPVAISANTLYVASYHSSNGYYALNEFYFNQPYTNLPLVAVADGVEGSNGVYKYGAAGFPNLAFNAANYWVDVIFSESGTPGPTATPSPTPTITTTPPTATPSFTPSPTAVGGAFPAAGVLDTFDRANGAIGSNWTGATTGFSIASNTLDVGTGGVINWNPTTFNSDQEAYVTLSTIDNAAAEINLYLKIQNNDWQQGVIEVWYEPGTAKVWVSTYSGGNWTTFSPSITVTFAPGDRFGARAKSNGVIEVYRNSTLLGSVTTSTFANVGGKIGLKMVNAAATVLNDFGGGNVVSGGPTSTPTPTFTPSNTPTNTPTPTATTTPPTATSSPTFTLTPSITPTLAPSTSLWPNNPIPATPAQTTDTLAVELGVKFRSAVSGFVTGIRFYKGATNTGTHTGHLWSSTGTLLGTLTFTGETATGWQQATFAAPIAITANTTYVASYHAPNGNYALDRNYFLNGFTNGNLYAFSSAESGGNGLFGYGPAPTFPTGSFENTNYWVDVIFSADGGPVPSSTPVPSNTPVMSNTPSLTPTPTSSPTLTLTPSITPTLAPSGSLWPNNPVPATPAQTADTLAVELGVKFRSSVNGFVTGIRFYKGATNTGTHTGHLWSSTGTLLGSLTFTGETASGWQQATFAAPIAITANTTYVASYHAPNGNYALDRNYFLNGFTNGNLYAFSSAESGGNGLYGYGPAPTFPTGSFENTNYWVDVIFSADGGPVPSSTPTNSPTATPTATNTATAVPAPMSLGNRVWLDNGTGAGGVANDGIQNGTEQGTAGVSVSLYADADNNSVPDGAALATDITDANGYYLFGNLSPGRYLLGVDAFNFTAGQVLANTVSSTPTFADNTDRNDNGVNTVVAQGILSNSILLTANTAPVGEADLSNNVIDGPNFRGVNGETDSNSDLTIDFGFVAAVAPTNTPTPTATPTNTPTATATPSDLIFANGFEAGNLTAWTSSTTNGGNLSVAGAAALNGVNGLRVFVNNNTSMYLTDDLPAAETNYRARFYFDPNTISMTSGNAHYIFYGYTGTTTVVTRIELVRTGTAYQIRAGLLNDLITWSNTSLFTITDAPHYIEIWWRKSTAAGANNGGLTLWIDGTQQANITGIDNDTRRIDRVRLGPVAGIDTGTRGTYYMDAFESRRTNYIGPIPGGVVAQIYAFTAPAWTVITPTETTVTAAEGSIASNILTVEGPEAVTLTASVGAVVNNGNGTWGWSLQTSDGPIESQTVTITSDNGQGITSTQTFELVVVNQPPTASFGSVTGNIVAGNSDLLQFSTVQDAGTVDMTYGFLYSYDCTNDGVFELTDSGSPAFPCPYDVEGSYTVLGRIKDKDGGFTDYTAVVNVSAAAPTAEVPVVPTEVAPVIPTVEPTPAPVSCPCTILGPSEPETAAVVEDTQAVTVGLKFRSEINGYVAGLRFYKGATNTGTHTGQLWAVDGTLLSEVTFSNESEAGWQIVALPTPVAVTANTTYVVSYHTSVGNYARSLNGLSAGITNSPLRALAEAEDGSNGVYSYGPSATFPNQPANGINFWVDVVFLTEAPALPVPTPLPVPTEVPDNAAPTLAASSDTVIVGEGQVAVMTGWVNDANGDAVALSASIGTVLNNGDGTWAWTWAASDGPSENQVVSITANDGRGGSAQTTFTLTVINEAPQASLQVEPGAINAGETVVVTFSGAVDASSVDVAAGFSYAFDCQADNNFEVNAGSNAVASCTFSSSGVYTVAGRVYDKDGAYSEYSATVTVNAVAVGGPSRLNRAT